MKCGKHHTVSYDVKKNMSRHLKKNNEVRIIKPLIWMLCAVVIIVAVYMSNTKSVLAFFTDRITNVNHFAIQASYTITFNSNTGSGTMSAQSISYNFATNLDANSYTKNGYSFGGWNTQADGSGTAYTDGQSVNNIDDVTLYAQWNPVVYNINYDLDGGTVATANPDTYTIETESFTINNPQKTGYAFKGWSGTGLTGNTNTSVTVVKGATGDRSYTANYTGNTYWVQFNSNGGIGTMSSQTMTYGVSSNLTANRFTKTGYVFGGWNTEADGTGTSYTNGQLVSNLTATNSATVILYAQWKLQPIKYAVQIYGINQDVGASNQTLGLTFGPAVGDNYNNKYVTHEYEETSPGSGVYNVVIVTHTVASNGTETTAQAYLQDSSSNNVTRTQSQVNERMDINLHEMSWADIQQVSDKTVFEDCMLCGDTKSVTITLNNTVASGNVYNQYGDGAGMLHSSIKNTTGAYFKNWNPSTSQNAAATNSGNFGTNGKDAGGYASSHIRATLVGDNQETDITYAGDVNLTSSTCIYSCIESELRDVITPKKIKYVTRSNNNYVVNSSIADPIWLFSNRELYGTGPTSDNTMEGLGVSGDGYDKFGNSESKYYISSYNRSSSSNRKAYSEPGGTEYWWLRSVNFGSSASLWSIYSAGQMLTHDARDAAGLAFGFCIQ